MNVKILSLKIHYHLSVLSINFRLYINLLRSDKQMLEIFLQIQCSIKKIFRKSIKHLGTSVIKGQQQTHEHVSTFIEHKKMATHIKPKNCFTFAENVSQVEFQ